MVLAAAAYHEPLRRRRRRGGTGASRSRRLAGLPDGRLARRDLLDRGGDAHPSPVAGVVSPSDEANLNGRVSDTGLDAETAATKLRAPVLYVVAKQDPLTPPADVAPMRKAIRSKGSRVAVFPGTFHGWDLLYLAPYRSKVDALVRAFLIRS